MSIYLLKVSNSQIANYTFFRLVSLISPYQDHKPEMQNQSDSSLPVESDPETYNDEIDPGSTFSLPFLVSLIGCVFIGFSDKRNEFLNKYFFWKQAKCVQIKTCFFLDINFNKQSSFYQIMTRFLILTCVCMFMLKRKRDELDKEASIISINESKVKILMYSLENSWDCGGWRLILL